jgi:uncharacterized membrane protein
MKGTEPARTARREWTVEWSTTAVVVAIFVLAGVAIGPGVGSVAAADNGDVEATFNATGTSGFVAINAESPDDPISFPTPDEVERPISVTGELYTNGTWRSTNVSFPALGEEQLGFPIEILLDAPRPFVGEIDREAGTMTVDAALTIIVPDADAEVNVTANITTGQSGEMTGDAEGLSTETATVTLVGNEYTVPEATGSTVIDEFVGLPSPEAGDNWFSLTLEMEFETNTGTVTGVVESTEGDPVEGATVALGDRQTTTGSDGAYELESTVGTQELSVERFGFADTTASVSVDTDETTTADVALEPVDTGTVAGVVESAAGNPVEGVTVSVGARETTTGADGSYELGVETGTRELTVAADGFTDASQSVLVETDTVATADIELVPAASEFSPVFVTATDATVGGTVELRALVQNVGPVEDTESVTLSVGGESFTESLELAPGGLGTVTAEWETEPGDEGSYEATATVSNRTAGTDLTVAGPEFAVSVSATDVVPGDTATVVATVRNEGDVAGTQEVTVSLVGADGTVAESVTESVELGAGEETEVQLEFATTAADAAEYDATVEVGEQTVTERLLVDDAVGEADFVVESTGGYMAYGYDTLADAEGQGLSFPDKNAGEEPIRIWGVINEEKGTWESTRTEFPMIEQQGLEGTVEAVGGLQGEVDRETGLLTATATYRVIIEGDEDTAFEFNMTMTTEESGEMTDRGDYEEVNDSFARVTFVGNEFPVDDQTGDSLADSTLSLPSPEPGRNYVELDFEVDYDPDEQPDRSQDDPAGDPTEDDSVETEPTGTLLATLGQVVGFAGLAGLVVVVLGGLYARFTGAGPEE